MKYCEIIDVENYTLKEIDSSFESQVEQWIESVSRTMDTMANRKLVADPVGSGEDYPVKYYDGNGEPYVIIDDCQEIVSVKIGDAYGDNLTEVTAYISNPRVPPHRAVILKNDIFTNGIQNVAIEGRFGYFDEIPADLRMACTTIVAGIINNQTKGGQMKRSESIGNYSVSYSDEKQIDDYEQAIETINRYKKHEL